MNTVEQMINELDSNSLDNLDALNTLRPKIDIDRLDVLDVLQNILND